MRKLIFICILLFGISSNVFADGEGSGSTGSNCIESRCMNDRMDELIKVNAELQKENKELQNKTVKFDSGFDNYVKLITESKEQATEKGKAYDIALSELKLHVYILGIILIIIAISFGFYKQNEIKNGKQEILDGIETQKGELRDYRLELRDYNKDQIELMRKSIQVNLNKEVVSDKLFKSLYRRLYNDLSESLISSMGSLPDSNIETINRSISNKDGEDLENFKGMNETT